MIRPQRHHTAQRGVRRHRAKDRVAGVGVGGECSRTGCGAYAREGEDCAYGCGGDNSPDLEPRWLRVTNDVYQNRPVCGHGVDHNYRPVCGHLNIDLFAVTVLFI